MPQARKRKAKEKNCEEVEKKGKKERLVLSKSTVKKEKYKTPVSSALTKVSSSSANFRSKKKITDSLASSDNESSNSHSRNKKTVVKNYSSQRKDPKLNKSKVVLHSLDVKGEHNDSDNLLFHNSTNNDIASENFTDTCKVESKLDITVKSEPSTSLCIVDNKQCNDDSSSIESILEEVEDHCEANLDDYKPDIPKEGVEVTIDCPDLHIQKRKKKQFDENDGIRLHINRIGKTERLVLSRHTGKMEKLTLLPSVLIKVSSSSANCRSKRKITDSPASSDNESSNSHSQNKKTVVESLCNVDNKQCNEDSSSSESEWEEVEDHCEASLDDYKPDIPKEGVEITIDCPDLRIRKRKKKQFDENDWIRLHINRIRKDIQLSIHKTHLLCLLAHGIYVNKVLNCDTVKGLALSLIPGDIFSYTSGKKVDKVDICGIEKVVSWFCNAFTFENEKSVFLNIFSSVMKSFTNQKSMNASEYNLMFIVIARILGFKVRFCVSLYPITYKAMNLIKKPSSKNSKESAPIKELEQKKETSPECNKRQKKVKLKKDQKASTSSKAKQINSSGSKKKKDHERISRPKRSTEKSYKLSSDEADDSDDKDFQMCDDKSSDDDFQTSRKINSRSQAKPCNKQSNRKILSSDSEPSSPQQSTLESGSIICWAEVYSKPDKQWISVECSNNIVNKPYDVEVLVPKPVSYILAYDNESYVKDVTRRYCNEYMTTTIKLRVAPEWWEDSLDPFLPPNSVQNKAEEKKLDEMLVNKPLPTTVQGFKNHPLYALKRHLLKFEAIYPADAPPVGFLRSEPIYARDCVHQLHSRETWLKEARVVRIGEQPYKIVKARPKWDKIAGVLRTDLPLEIFGHWQTQPYEPPIAVDGKVPRNEYGNVELFKPCMLPRGTVHLQLPGLNRIAKKLGIDCSPAVVGFDGHKGSVHAVFDGFIICEEFKDTIIAAWDEEQENSRKREEEKREKRIYGNWKKLIRGLLIKERIKLKYGTK